MLPNIYVNSHAKLRVLLIELEFTTWRRARSWSYASQLGLEEGLRANGVEYLTITTPWFSQAQEICAGKHFDQVWIEIVHNDLDKTFLQWVATLAPVRIGMMGESLEYYLEEYAIFPILKERLNMVEERFKYFTHVSAGDEKDIEYINRRGQIPAFWWPQAIPERFICEQVTKAPRNYAVFSGGVYGERGSWLELPELKGLLAHQPSPEEGTIYPGLFDSLHVAVRRFLRDRMQGDDFIRLMYVYFLRMARRPFITKCALSAYLYLLRLIRRRCFARWLEGMQTGCAVVNLPHFAKFYTGRVAEGMAAGQPVVAWEVPDRPMNRALFEDGVEILLYSTPEQLAAHIQRVLSNPDLGKQIAANARRKLKRFHTIEKRVQQILNWIETGETPRYV